MRWTAAGGQPIDVWFEPEQGIDDLRATGPRRGAAESSE